MAQKGGRTPAKQKKTNTTAKRLEDEIEEEEQTVNITLEIITPLTTATMDAIYPIPAWSDRVYIVCLE